MLHEDYENLVRPFHKYFLAIYKIQDYKKAGDDTRSLLFGYQKNLVTANCPNAGFINGFDSARNLFQAVLSDPSKGIAVF